MSSCCDDSHQCMEKKIALLIDDLIEVGCEIYAVGRGYCIDEPANPDAVERMSALLKAFGPRQHLVADFNRILADRGLIVEL